ncbi:hypothetical protein QM012_005593 [Aureobasidium pullulans]|uniref:ABM domain-containing protein n=1 Tax=Aureobasidium pullulans TaxID=5580 RepID=A0ABR0T4D2_AURPU
MSEDQRPVSAGPEPIFQCIHIYPEAAKYELVLRLLRQVVDHVSRYEPDTLLYSVFESVDEAGNPVLVLWEK